MVEGVPEKTRTMADIKRSESKKAWALDVNKYEWALCRVGKPSQSKDPEGNPVRGGCEMGNIGKRLADWGGM